MSPGDWVVGDEDGVVIIPAARLAKVLKAAEHLRQVEKEIQRDIRRGKDLASVLRYDDVLRRKSTEVFLPQMRFKKGRIRK